MHVTEGVAVESSLLAGGLAPTLTVAALVYIRGWLRPAQPRPDIASPWLPCVSVGCWRCGSPLVRPRGYDHCFPPTWCSTFCFGGRASSCSVRLR